MNHERHVPYPSQSVSSMFLKAEMTDPDGQSGRPSTNKISLLMLIWLLTICRLRRLRWRCSRLRFCRASLYRPRVASSWTACVRPWNSGTGMLTRQCRTPGMCSYAQPLKRLCPSYAASRQGGWLPEANKTKMRANKPEGLLVGSQHLQSNGICSYVRRLKQLSPTYAASHHGGWLLKANV